MLLGSGFSGGLGGAMSFIGLLLQLALLFFVVKFVMNFLRNRRLAGPGSAYTPSGSAAPFGGAPPAGGGAGLGAGLGGGLGGAFGGLAGGLGGGGAPRQTKLDIGPADFSTFQQRLGEVQKAYSDEDGNALRALTTPEMASYFADDLAENARKGVVNRLSNVAFLQGDLSEAWREPDADYATVAMRFSLTDAMLDRASGRVVSGDLSTPTEATELWTFTRRPVGGPADWRLSGIQQAQNA
jgi:predicted lipid-binding transport protein (Tim44 family)